MLRAAVVVFHLALASALALELTLALVQTRLYLLWERAFYGAGHAETLLAGGVEAGALAVAGMEFLVALAWLFRRPWSGSAILAISAALMLVVTPGVGWGLLAMGVLVGVEEIRSRLPRWEEIFEEDEEDL
jgi:hypothetical protein